GHERLRRKVEDPVRLDLGHGVERRCGVAEVALVKLDVARLQVLDVLRAAAPAPDAVDLAVTTGQQVVHEVASGEARDAGDQDPAHRLSLSVWGRKAAEA